MRGARLLNPLVTRLSSLRRRTLFRLWVERLRFELRRQGARLILEVGETPIIEGVPRLKILPQGEGDATFTLRIGRGVILGKLVELEIWAGGTNVLELEDEVHILSFNRLKLRSGRIRLGSQSHLREWCMLKSSGNLDIGEAIEISYFTTIHCDTQIVLEDWVGITDRVTIVDSEHTVDGSGDDNFFHRPVRVDPVLVERNTFLAANSVVLAGSHIGPNAAVAAGAILTGGDYPGGWLIAGIPAKPVKPLSALAAASAERSDPGPLAD